MLIFFFNDNSCSFWFKGRLLFAFLSTHDVMSNALEDVVELVFVFFLLFTLKPLLHLLMLRLSHLSRILLLFELVELFDCG